MSIFRADYNERRLFFIAMRIFRAEYYESVEYFFRAVSIFKEVNTFYSSEYF